ncbi:MAG TPA: hypothetical protein VG034_10560 [Acidimicrobiia bacterium]|jgi:phytoene dehydrogenase-like protein|nr:hypothetical protein [Acidimicrobiia bacterium]
MAIDERARHQLYLRLEEHLGPEAASTLMEHLPPTGWSEVATKRDLDHLREITSSDIQRMGDQLRAEFQRGFAEQTRTVVLANIGMFVAMAGVAFAAARLT